jgi:hypothetical protein
MAGYFDESLQEALGTSPDKQPSGGIYIYFDILCLYISFLGGTWHLLDACVSAFI